jgi:hypothetical protein
MFAVLISSRSYAFSAGSTANLAALIPPGAAMVVGMEARHRNPERPYLFIPLPGKSLRDLDYFNSLCGADPTKWVNEVIFVDGELDRANYDHTLLARGRFNSVLLYRSALSQGAIQEFYRGLSVLQVPPLTRERSEFDEFTWLTIIDSRLLLLGTPEYVRHEMDRLVVGSAPDPLFSEQITAVQRSDVWWIIRKPSDTSVVKDALMSLSSDLGELLTQQNLIVGMRYGRQAVFEYDIGISTNRTPSPAREFTWHEPPGLDRFAPVSGETVRSHGLIKIPRDRYRRWITELATRPTSYR